MMHARPSPSASHPTIRLASGEQLVDYATAARILGTTKNTLKTCWIRSGQLKPTAYSEGRRRFLLLADVERAKAVRARVASSRRLFTVAEAADYLQVSKALMQP